ncbi:MAG: IPT/TIG domain-containing protein [Anaerolineae bacterium]|nr:IPT/TIG domain-containing protein [Anaerolineae bacterium]
MRYRTALGALVLLVVFSAISVLPVQGNPIQTQLEQSEPEPDPTQTRVPPLQFTNFEPQTITGGQNITLSIHGVNFTANTTVSLTGFGHVPAQFVSAQLLQVVLPATLGPGQYTIQINDPMSASVIFPTPLQVMPIAEVDTPTPTNTPIPPIQVTTFEPTEITSGQTAVLSLYGANFTNNTTVNLVGFGNLTIISVTSDTITVAVPLTVSAGAYALQVSDPVRGMATYSQPLKVVPPTATPQPTATNTPTHTPIPPIQATNFEPKWVTGGQASSVTIYGANFTTNTTIRLIGKGLLDTTFINSTTLTALVPSSVVPGRYTLQASDPAGGTVTLPGLLGVSKIPVTPLPTATPTWTPSPVPGEPSLLIHDYTVSPRVVAPGGTVTFTVQVVNIGNKYAQAISMSIDPGSNFIPASNQATVLLPDIRPGGNAVVSLRATASTEATGGPSTIPVTIAYRDFNGGSYSTSATLNATVETVVAVSQVSLSSYTVQPNPAQPGESVTVNVEIANTGTENAQQVLLQIGANEGVLLAGPQGSSFPIGDIPAGSSINRDLSLVVSGAAAAGPQSQSITISYLQAGETRQESGSMTIAIAASDTPVSLLLLDSYDFGQEFVQPGESFTLTLTLINVGNAAVNDLLVNFNSSQTAADPSRPFIPVGSGGTVYFAALDGNRNTVQFTQDFMVNGSVESGIYQLPITLKYRGPNNTDSEISLGASIVVIRPPRVLIQVDTPLPSIIETGDTASLELTLINTGQRDINFTFARVEAENAEIFEGEQTFIGLLETGGSTTLTALIMPLEAGPMTVTVMLDYLNDLNRDDTLITVYEAEAVEPPPPPPVREDPITPPVFVPTPTPTPEPEGDVISRLLRGLLGLGS